MVGPRDYKITTIKRLYTLSGGMCANPNCNNSLIGNDEKTLVDEIVHIESAGEKGPRYNPNMDVEKRRSFDNLMLLCKSCHKIIDQNESEYPVMLLKEWKKKHESSQKELRLKDLNILKIAVKAISEINFDQIDVSEENSLKIVNPEEKIKYNNIKENKSLIEEYKVYHAKINSIYSELERQGSFRKEKLLRNIHTIYLKVKGKYVLDKKNEIEEIQKNADKIIDEIQEELLSLISQNQIKNDYFEILLIMVDAFIRCKIMEEPQ